MREPRFSMRAGSWVLAAGLTAGTLDLLFATSFWAAHGVPAIRILQSIAAGVLGAEARQGGVASASLGAALHYLIATGMAVAYYLASLQWRVLVRRPVPCGLAYGVFLYLAMRLLVVPLSAAPTPASAASNLPWLISSIAAHMLLVGLPCALFARRANRSRTALALG
jgi:hypothetical protein